MHSLTLHVEGVVQGVGFRPFVYRIAKRNNLRGYVKNLGDAGVEIIVQGNSESIEKFLTDLRLRAPPLARIEEVRMSFNSLPEMDDFRIVESSKKGKGGNSVIPPDVAICDDCLRELFDPNNPRYLYPFIVCTNCGPRFSIIESLPYDRSNTAMRDFPMCNFCRSEYEDPLNRRYHAEPVCCERCGPRYELVDNRGELVDGDPIKMAAKLLDEGYIVAIKGIGGFHIACDAMNADAVEKLRKALRREQQPFALMARSIDVVKRFALMSGAEEREMKSYRRPIILLRKRDPFPLPDSIAPGLHTVGVMLPYAGTHYILFHHGKADVYVMTSANYPDSPMVKDNERIYELDDVVDYFLIHNRRIVNRVDDSVIRFVSGKRAVIRKSRGFVPLPIEMKFSYSGLAMGAELMNSFSIVKENRIYPSQYIGNTYRVEVLQFMREAISSMERIIGVENYDLIVVDSHPLYNTSRLGREIAEERGIEVLNVQHHIAHIAAVMAEKGIDEVVGIAIDAVGYGLDGKIWGGEVISVAPDGVRRHAHISYFPLPGGDLASSYPIRSLVGILSKIYETDEIEDILERVAPFSVSSLPGGRKELRVVLRQVEREINVSYASSLGRVLDAISSLLGVCQRRTYEGEPAMKLESFALRGRRDLGYNIPSRRGEIGIEELFAQILDSMEKGERREDVALSAHLAIARALIRKAIEVAMDEGIESIAVGGGVAYNEIINGEMERICRKEGFEYLVSSEVPRGDNGISVGQAYLGGMYLDGMLKRNEIGVMR